MMELPQIADYESLFIYDTPLIDVRAPVEFAQGAFPLACNLPLMNDDERHQVGIRYKEDGQQQAIELGHTLVQGTIKRQRITDWQHFAQQHPQGALYCFRGGLRSKISQQWLYETTGILYPRISGGYKALRRYLINQLDTCIEQLQPIILGGRTGAGKTLLLDQIEHKVDLEHIYQHRGSAFGKHALPQPNQIDIENTLAIQLMKYRYHDVKHILLEDEAANIGSRQLPRGLLHHIRTAPLILLETPTENRIDNIFNEYITQSLKEYQQLLGDQQGYTTWSENLLSSLKKISRRLGGQRYKTAHGLMQTALQNNDMQQHKQWIGFLLAQYYDPMYDYQLNQKTDRILFKGDHNAILAHLAQQHRIH